VSAVGDDEAGRGLLAHARESGIDVSTVKITKTLSAPDCVEGKPKNLTLDSTSSSTSTSNTPVPVPVTAATATYTAIHDTTGTLALAIADVRVIQELSPHTVQQHTQLISDSHLIVVDGNISPHTFNAVLNTAHSLGVPLFFEPTSDHKCVLPILTGTMSKVCPVISVYAVLCAMCRFVIVCGAQSTK
jgi:sugar/nucleoside kinase (ribokinase family)